MSWVRLDGGKVLPQKGLRLLRARALRPEGGRLLQHPVPHRKLQRLILRTVGIGHHMQTHNVILKKLFVLTGIINYDQQKDQ
jgi:hypothetical protein